MRFKAQDSGEMTVAILRNGIEDFSLPLSLLPEVASEEFARHLFSVNVTDHQITIRISNGNRDDDFHMIDYGARAWVEPMA